MSRDSTAYEYIVTDEGCTSTTSFADHGVDDGSDLITRTYYRLAREEQPEFAPTADFFDDLTEAFTHAYLQSVDESEVPAHVAAAIDDARALTLEEFEDDPDADVRTDVLPAFYRHVSGFHCAYRG